MSKTKVCGRCKEEKSLDDFHKDSRRACGYRCYCKICNSIRCKQYRADNKESQKIYRDSIKEDRRNIRLIQRYGIDINTYDSMLRQQDYKCKICKNEEIRKDYRTGEISRLAVDHCHKTGNVRGLLCNKCNVMLGLVDDSISYLNDLIKYVIDSNE